MSDNQSNEQTEVTQEEAIPLLYRHVQQVLEQQFEGFEVKGQVGQHPVYDPVFAYTLKRNGNVYSCGFFFNELLNSFQNRDNPAQWLSSFFIDLTRSPESRPLPNPPQSEEDAKALIEQQVVPNCAHSAREEFSQETVYVGIGHDPEQGAVLEAGFPSIKEGNNMCTLPLHYLMTLHLLNRDPAEPLIEALYKIHNEHHAG